MEVQIYEFTVDELLFMHQYWIIKLYAEEGRTEVEIVLMLQERQVFVSASQIRTCLRQWGVHSPLMPSFSEPLPAHQPEHTTNGCETNPSLPVLPPRSSPSRTATDASLLNRSSKQQPLQHLPNVPPELPPKLTSSPPRAHPSLLAQYEPQHVHARAPSPPEVEEALPVAEIPLAISRLLVYVEDYQEHERRAVDLGIMPAGYEKGGVWDECSPLFVYRRAADLPDQVALHLRRPRFRSCRVMRVQRLAQEMGRSRSKRAENDDDDGGGGGKALKGKEKKKES